MAYFREIPYTTLSQLNLDWLIKGLQNLETDINNFVALNTIKYADPFDWNITTQYAMNTLVFNQADYTAYLSVKPVPSGVQIDNTDYWTPVFTLEDVLTAYRDAITPVFEQAGSPATTTIEKGQLFWIESSVYSATAKINQGDTVAIGTNCASTSISAEILKLAGLIGDEQNAREQADQQLQNAITAERTAREQADQQLQNVITAEQTARENADNALQVQINTLKTANIPIFIGDSYALGAGDSTPAKFTGWAALLAGIMGAVNNSVTIAAGGCGFCNPGEPGKNFLGLLKTFTGNKNNVSSIVVCGGYNDNGYSFEALQQAVSEFCVYAKDNYPNAKIYVGMIANAGGFGRNDNIRLALANNVLPAYAKCTVNGAIYLTGVEQVLKDYSLMSHDDIHPNQNGYNAIAGAIFAAISSGFSAISGFTAAEYTPYGTANNPTIGTAQVGNQVFFYFSNLILSVPSFSITTPKYSIYLGSFSFAHFRPTIDKGTALCQVSGYLQTTSNAQYEIEGYLRLENTSGGYIQIYSLSGGTTLQINDINYINIDSFQFTLPTKYC